MLQGTRPRWPRGRGSKAGGPLPPPRSSGALRSRGQTRPCCPTAPSTRTPSELLGGERSGLGGAETQHRGWALAAVAPAPRVWSWLQGVQAGRVLGSRSRASHPPGSDAFAPALVRMRRREASATHPWPFTRSRDTGLSSPIDSRMTLLKSITNLPKIRHPAPTCDSETAAPSFASHGDGRPAVRLHSRKSPGQTHGPAQAARRRPARRRSLSASGGPCSAPDGFVETISPACWFLRFRRPGTALACDG